MRWLSLFAVAVGVAGLVPSVRAASVAFGSSADTTIIELAPDNNMGGHVFFNAGTTLHGSKNRGLLRFDVASQIPPGSKITSAQVTLEVVGIPIDEPAGTTFGLYRLLRPWGEGVKTSLLGPGRGDIATDGEATWNHSFASTNAWGAPGGLSDVDFVSASSGEQFLEPSNNSSYTFGSSAQMVADVQMWIDSPESNYGWLLKTADEELTTTARRFASREDPEYAPQLVVEFEALPLLEVSRSGSKLLLSFVAEPNRAYVLESADGIGSTWNAHSNIAAEAEARTIHFTNSVAGTARFFRIVVSE